MFCKNGTSDSEEDDEEDFEGTIYGGIMRSVGHIMKVSRSTLILKCYTYFCGFYT